MGESKELEILMKSKNGCSGSTWTHKVKREEVMCREQDAGVSDVKGEVYSQILWMGG